GLRISSELRSRMVYWHEDLHLSPPELAQFARCSLRTVQYVLSYHRDFNTLTKPSLKRQLGRPRILSIGDISYIKGLIDLRPKIFLDEIQDYLYRYRHVD
ncbi:hypothetical protein BKA70DRAFT_1044426, partial [Coprinopsis sp. MPI-PUGE-AT-0042]